MSKIKQLLWCLLGFCVNLSAGSDRIRAVDVTTNAGLASTQSSFAWAELYVAYFRYYGVHSVALVVCQEEKASLSDQMELLFLLNHFHTNGFYVQLLDGLAYNDLLNAPPTPPAKPFVPPITFRTDNETRRPLLWHLNPLPHKSGFLLLRFDSPCALNVLRWSAASEQNHFAADCFWLLLARTSAELQLLEDDEIFLPPDSEVRVLLKYSTAGAPIFTLVDVYKTAAEQRTKQRVMGAQLRSVEELYIALQRFGSSVAHRDNLDGTYFNSGLVISFPEQFTDIEDISSRHIDTISKVTYRLTAELANRLNARFNKHQVDNFGWRKPNGSFDGMMGQFQRYELDFAQNGIFMRLERMELCSFVAETMRVRAGLMFRQPPLSAVANIFSLPFQDDVWISILLLMIFTTIVLLVELTYSPVRLDMHIYDCFMFVWGAVCQQSFHLSVKNLSARIMLFTTFVATLFLFTSFAANIVALLQSPSEAIQTLSDLSKSPLEIGVQNTVYNRIFFNESTDPVTSRLYRTKMASKGNSLYMDPILGMKRMRTSLFAYQIELQAGYKIISDTFSEPEKCGLKELEPFQLPILGIPTRKNFPYKQLFRKHLRWQREVGILKREEIKWFPQKPKCEGGIGGFVSIGITECRYAFLMYGAGVILGVGCFLLELLLTSSCTIWQRMQKLGETLAATEHSS